MSISARPYGSDHKGNKVTEYTLKNRSGAYVGILDFGGIITRICVPDKSGALGDVCLGFDDVMSYTADSGGMGALIGRTGNRIDGASFELCGKTYTLGKNALGRNNLHGGPDGFNLRMWEAEPNEKQGEDELTLRLISPDMDQGFPGTLSVTVVYGFNDENDLTITYRAETDKTTIINLTNHAYFNLDGHDSGTVEEQELSVHADCITEVREGLIPTGRLKPVDGLPYDLRTPRLLGDVLKYTDECPDLRLGGGIDLNYCAGRDREDKLIAVLYSPKTGREMLVVTDQPGVQIYTGQGLHQTGKGGLKYPAFGGVCLETQHYADAIHHPHFPSIVLRPEDVYYTRTEYRFRVR